MQLSGVPPQTRLPLLLTILTVIFAAIFAVEYIQFNSSGAIATTSSDSTSAAANATIDSSSEQPLANNNSISNLTPVSTTTTTKTTAVASNQSQAMSQQNVTSTVQTMTTKYEAVINVVGPQAWLQAGRRGAITGSFNAWEINVTRGKTVDVVLTLKYTPGVNPLPNVTITPHGDGGMILPPSVSASVDPLQTIRSMQQNKSISGALFTKDLTSFEPSSISLKPGESKEIVVHITVPQNWPDEMVGKETPITPTFSFIDNGVGFFVDPVQVRIIG